MRTFGLTVIALLAPLAACVEAPQEAGPSTYLALGDSVAFGFDPLVDMRATRVESYADVIGTRWELDVTNASCPGEATGGFISPIGNDNHCRENRIAYPLHVTYDGTQLAFALDYLANHPNTTLVTIDIGGNDASKLNDVCAGDVACVVAGFLPMLTDYGHNLDLMFGEIRKVYDGPLVALTLYNPFPTDTLATYGLDKLNATLATKAAAYDGVVAHGMEAFDAASGGDPCAAGLLIGLPDGTCDVHPSAAGDVVLADAIFAALAR